VKRVFDVVLTVLAMLAWVPALILAGLAILVLEGWPVLYVSRRRVLRDRVQRVVKFRTMRRDAHLIANRATVPYDGTRFLNLPPDSPLYTPVGRVIERLCITELPQLFHVLAGEMSLVGNRPLPDDVFAALLELDPAAGERFDTPAGLCGPAQLAGRERLTDRDRLRIESAYCRVARTAYSPRLDFLILVNTVLMGSRLRPHFDLAEVEALVARYDRSPAVRAVRARTSVPAGAEAQGATPPSA